MMPPEPCPSCSELRSRIESLETVLTSAYYIIRSYATVPTDKVLMAGVADTIQSVLKSKK